MIIWQYIGENEDGIAIYGRTDEDGKMRITAVVGYPELDEWLEKNKVKEDN
jgi:hypothetical protein